MYIILILTKLSITKLLHRYISTEILYIVFLTIKITDYGRDNLEKDEWIALKMIQPRRE